MRQFVQITRNQNLFQIQELGLQVAVGLFLDGSQTDEGIVLQVIGLWTEP